jgi:hypothetical protein
MVTVVSAKRTTWHSLPALPMVNGTGRSMNFSAATAAKDRRFGAVALSQVIGITTASSNQRSRAAS